MDFFNDNIIDGTDVNFIINGVTSLSVTDSGIDVSGDLVVGGSITGTGFAVSGTNTGDETTTSIGNLVNGATSKTTPVDADQVPLMDSAASNIIKKLSWSNIKATLKTYFDAIYKPLPIARTYSSVSLANNTTRTPSSTKDVMVLLTVSLESAPGQTATVVAQVDNSGGGSFTTVGTGSNVNGLNVTLGLLQGTHTQVQMLSFVVPKSSQYKYITSGTGTSTITSHYELEL